MNAKQLKITADKANSILKEIKAKYIGLSGYLVFASQSGQCKMTADIMDLLKYFPDMIKPCSDKEKALVIIKAMAVMPKKGKEGVGGLVAKLYKDWEAAITELICTMDKLEVKEDTLVEIRFTKANSDMIFDLQKDELISRQHTPQTPASIQIVLGTLQEIYRKQ